MLTTSQREEDVAEAYRAGANTFIRKPDEYALYQELVTTLHRYWGLSALRPPRRLHA